MAIDSIGDAPANYLWVALNARIYEVFPPICPFCSGKMRIIAVITDGSEVKKILEHIGVESRDSRIGVSRWPQLWDDGDAPMGEVWMPCQTGIWRRDRYPFIRSISASVGGGSSRRFCSASGRACAFYRPRALLDQRRCRSRGTAV